jgi:hypothetical protein
MINENFYNCAGCCETFQRDDLAMDDAGDYYCADCEHLIDAGSPTRLICISFVERREAPKTGHKK